MIIDAFIFNNELEILLLRLNFLNDIVDRFVIVESKRTLAGADKPLHFYNNRHLFQPFLNKIVYLEAPANDLTPWEYEFFQRNYLKKGLEDCAEDDIVFISDVDEIVNIKDVIERQSHKLPALIELPMYYYYLNLKTSSTFFVNLAGSWSFIKNLDLGYRYQDYPKYTSSKIRCDDVITGWHFSYLFGEDILRYQQKIRSFSHQEFNTPYYLNPNRIKKCVTLGIDLFERTQMKLFVDNQSILPIRDLALKLGMNKYFYTSSFKHYLKPGNLFFLLKTKLLRIIGGRR